MASTAVRGISSGDFSVRMKTLSCFALTLAFVLPLRADPLEQRLDKLRLNLSAAATKAAAETPTEPERARRQTATAEMLRRYAEILQPDSGEGMAGALRQINTLEGLPPEVTAELNTLLRDLPKLTEERDEQALAAIDALVKKVAPACLAAKEEAELDPLLRELSRPLRGQSSRSENPRFARSLRKLQAAQRAVSQWQDYLAHRAAGNAKAADTVLQSIGSQSDYPIIAQEEISRRISSKEPTQGDAEAVRILREVKSLDGLPAVLAELRARLGAREAEYSARFATLNQIANAGAAYRAGFFGLAFQTATATPSAQEMAAPAKSENWNTELVRLQGLLLLEVLPRYLELPTFSPPAPGENGATYLLRLADDGAAAGRWMDTARIVDTYRLVAFRNPAQAPPWIAEDVVGLKAFAAAEQLATAQAFAEAMKSFRQAAESGGKYTPGSRAAARLGEITAAHPEEAKVAAAAGQSEQLLQQLQQKLVGEAVRAMELRLPPDIRNRMTPPRTSP